MSDALPVKLVIASRESLLAMWQAEYIRDRLTALYPQMRVEILGMTTQGDRILDKPLAKIGGKGLFVKELELALESGDIHMAVHSLKDVPSDLSPQFCITAVLPRANTEDVLITREPASFETLPAGSRIGTSSVRRSQLTYSHFAWVISLRRPPVSSSSMIACAAV